MMNNISFRFFRCLLIWLYVYIQRRGVLGYVALFKAVVLVKIEHASAVVSAHGGEVAVLEDERRAVLNAYAGVAAAFYGCPEALPAFADEVRAVAVGEKPDAVNEHEVAVFAAVVISHVEPAHCAGAEPRKDFSAFICLLERPVRAGCLECVHHELKISAAGVDYVGAHKRIVYVFIRVFGVGQLERFDCAAELFKALPNRLVALDRKSTV